MNPRKILIGAGAAAMSMAAVLAVSPAAEAATPAITVSKIQYDSPGPDNRSNASLNAEYIRLKNNTTRSINLNKFTVTDKAGHRYTFSSYLIPSGRYVYVHTGRGTNGVPDSQHRYWGSGNYIWNNTGDSVVVRTSTGGAIDSCTYRPRRSDSGITYC